MQQKREKQKEGWKGELQCATINYSPPKLQMGGVTFHSVPAREPFKNWT